MSNQLQSFVKHDQFMPAEFNEKQIQLLKDTICKGSTPEEFNLFCMICKHTGLDPFLKQIYPVKRWNAKLGREEMTCQTSIDGYRLVAEKTGRYCPGRESTYTYDKNGHLLSATSYVKKLTADGTWHEVSATAFYSEYVQTFPDKMTKELKPTQFWLKMPHVMLAKCAEALALRKGWPAQLGTIYTSEEMEQADPPPRSPESRIDIVPQIKDMQNVRKSHIPEENNVRKPNKKQAPPSNEVNVEYATVENISTDFDAAYLITPAQCGAILELIKGDGARLAGLLAHYKLNSIQDLPAEKYDEVIEILSQERVK